MAGHPENSVESLFEDLSYGNALEGEAIAQQWLEKNARKFGCFIGGIWYMPVESRVTVEVKKPSTGSVLASVLKGKLEDVSLGVSSSRGALNTWQTLSSHARALHLYSIARNLQKHQSLLAVLESVNTGMPIRESRGISGPAIVRQFYHNAGWAELRNEEVRGWAPYGVTVIVVSQCLPLMELSSRVAPALAMGNTLLLTPQSAAASLNCLLFAEICAQAGLPKGVVNVVCLPDLTDIASQTGVDKIFFTGSLEDWVDLSKLTANSSISLGVQLYGRCPIIITEDVDLDSAVEGVIEAAFFNSGQSLYAGSRLLIQEPVFQVFIKKLKARMSKLTIGDNMDKNNDQGPLSDKSLAERVLNLIGQAKTEGAEVFQPTPVPGNSSNYVPPTLITGAQMSSDIYLQPFLGPVTVAVPFRTVKEGIAMANHSTYGLGASVWAESVSVALEIASMLQVGTVWINSHHLYDAGAETGGSKTTGSACIGGKQGLFEFLRPSWQLTEEVDLHGVDGVEASSKSNDLPSVSTDEKTTGPSIDKTYKLFYGGGQKRPDSGASRPLLTKKGLTLAYVPEGGVKDIRGAVDAALKASAGWGKRPGHGRAQILYYIAENLESRKSEFANLLMAMTDQSESECLQEVCAAQQRLFQWAAHADKTAGKVQDTSMYGVTLTQYTPVGVIGIVCPNNYPLLGFVSLMAPAVAMGNAVVCVPSEKYPLAALSFHQILETSDVPAGVINIVTGDNGVLTKALTDVNDVAAIWYFGSSDGSNLVEQVLARTARRTWVNNGLARNLYNRYESDDQEVLNNSKNCKTIWMPMGDIFAN